MALKPGEEEENWEARLGKPGSEAGSDYFCEISYNEKKSGYRL
jgi:hypothetical protein